MSHVTGVSITTGFSAGNGTHDAHEGTASKISQKSATKFLKKSLPNLLCRITIVLSFEKFCLMTRTASKISQKSARYQIYYLKQLQSWLSRNFSWCRTGKGSRSNFSKGKRYKLSYVVNLVGNWVLNSSTGQKFSKVWTTLILYSDVVAKWILRNSKIHFANEFWNSSKFILLHPASDDGGAWCQFSQVCSLWGGYGQ